MKFIWLTENYRVNIDSIFSLERKYIENIEAVKAWYDSYQTWKDDIIVHGIHTDTIDIDIDDIDNNHQIIDSYIKNMIGECPLGYTIEYYIILSTGVKVNISEDKFNVINEAIDSI